MTLTISSMADYCMMHSARHLISKYHLLMSKYGSYGPQYLRRALASRHHIQLAKKCLAITIHYNLRQTLPLWIIIWDMEERHLGLRGTLVLFNLKFVNPDVFF